MAGTELIDVAKKKNSAKVALKGLFSLSTTSLSKEEVKHGNNVQADSPSINSSSSSHRFFLRKKNSRASLSPQSSTSSLSSLMKKFKSPNNSNQELSQKVANQNDNASSGSYNQNFTLDSDINGNNEYPIGTEASLYGAEYSDRSKSASSIRETLMNNKSSANLSDDTTQSQQQNNHINHSEKVENSVDRNNLDTKHKSRRSHHSHLSLKRFLKKLKHADSSDSTLKSHKSRSSILPQHSSSDLFKKYGPLGRLLGTGASGSVNLVSLKDDSTKIYAVKKFRAKLQNETDHDYKTKVKNEFKIGEYLRHQNLIHTIELIKENNAKLLGDSEYYIVMEYCPFDFFNLVMSGLMNHEEVACYFRQIANGVSYLHLNGLAHRDLKLDNCVVDGKGILKLIDFGSAVQFRKEKTTKNRGEDDIDEQHQLVRSRGIVGSDPYLAPEVFEPTNLGYDPRLVDVWSIAIIYCCMILRRFPWKIPKTSDPSYKSFAGVPDEDFDDTNKLTNSMKDLDLNKSSESSNTKKPPSGPDRLLRLLPSESRDLIRNMLAISPKERFLIDDVLKDEFFFSIQFCHMTKDEGGEEVFKKSDNHSHHLITEEDLQKINMEKERIKKLKGAGVA